MALPSDITNSSTFRLAKVSVPFPPDRLLWMSTIPDVWELYPETDTVEGEKYLAVANQPGYSNRYSYGCRDWSKPYRWTGPTRPDCIDHDAWRSAVAMLKEHDARIADAGALPSVVTSTSFQELEAELLADLSLAQDIRGALLEAAEAENIEAAEVLEKELAAILKRRDSLEQKLYNKSVEMARKNRANRMELFWHYYDLSVQQFASDREVMRDNEPTRIHFSIDGIIPFTRERIRQKEFEHFMRGQIENDLRVARELIAAGRSARELVELSRGLVTDPVSKAFVERLVDEEIPPVVSAPQPDYPGSTPGAPWAVELEFAPETTLEGANDPGLVILRDPSRPATPDNIMTPEELRERELRIAQRVVDDAPEYYPTEWDKNQNPAKWRTDAVYWRANYPTAELRVEDNTHIDPKSLFEPWQGPGEPPLVNLWIMPRRKPLPPKGFLAKYDWIATVATIVIAAIPVVGMVAAVGVSFALNQTQASQVKSWAKEVGEFPPSVFAPQFFPQDFSVPLPLPLAQYLVKNPWFIPVEVDRFVKEYAQQELEYYQDVYEDKAGEQIGNPAFNDLPAQGTVGLGDAIFGTTKSGQRVSVGSSAGSGGSVWGVLAVGAVVAALVLRKKR